MKAYLDLTLIDDADFTPMQLISALFNKLHRALVECGQGQIGVSFPFFNEKTQFLGSKIRLHGSVSDLTALMELAWLKGMRDHLRPVEILTVPETLKGFVCVQRVQAKSNAARLQRRRMKRKGESEAEAQAAISKSVETHLALPFIQMKSASTGQPFPLFIRQIKVAEPQEGLFSSYGLSPSATVPFF